MEWTELEGGAKVFFNGKNGFCKSCKTAFSWGVTKNNKWMPVVKDENGKFVSHFSNCPGAGEYRKRDV